MTDKNDDYYQPWTQGKPIGHDPSTPPRAETPSAAPQHGTAHQDAGPQDPHLPPIGMDLSRYAEQEKGVRPPLLDSDKIRSSSAAAWAKLRGASARFADWTIQLGQKADIPTRVKKMEIPRRTKDLARRSAAAAAEATRTAAEVSRTAAEGTAKASKASAAKSKEIWEKMALADKVGNMASEAGRGLTDIADKTKQGLGQVARAGKETIGETAEKLRPQRSDEETPKPPLSGLEQLLAREEQEERKAADAKSTAELPLFSEDQPHAAAINTEGVGASDIVDGALSSEHMNENENQREDSAIQPEPVTTSVNAAQPPAPRPIVTPTTAQVPTADAAADMVSSAAAISTPIPTPTPVPTPAPAPAPPPSPAPATSPSFFDENMTHHNAPPSDAAPHDPRPVPNYEVVNRAPAAATSAAPASTLPTFSARTWALGGAALIALLGSSYWLGSRFGGGMSKADVETIVADYITTNPQIIPAALEAQRDREIAKAIDAVRPALEKPYAGAWGGNADGDVTLVVFTDYACGFCRASVPDIDRLLREDKRLKVVYRELPIISRESRSAALMALAAARQGKYDAFHHAMFAQSSLAPSAIIKAAEQAGVSLDGSGDATADEALFQRELESNLALGNQLQLNATPTWVIGDQLLQGQVGFDALRDAIARTRTKQAS